MPRQEYIIENINCAGAGGKIIELKKLIAQVPRQDYIVGKILLPDAAARLYIWKNWFRRCRGEIIQLKKLIVQVPRRDYTIEKIDCAGAA